MLLLSLFSWLEGKPVDLKKNYELQPVNIYFNHYFNCECFILFETLKRSIDRAVRVTLRLIAWEQMGK